MLSKLEPILMPLLQPQPTSPPPPPPPSPRHFLPPLLASLPAAAVSSQPPTALLPLLSPILRQRVQLLSAETNDPWLPLLCYDPEKANKLSEIAQSDKLEPHPVSGEVEADWDGEVETLFKRVDEETLEAYVSLREFDLSVKLLFCIADQEYGGGDGWRIGEVSALDSSSLFDPVPRGWESIAEAEGRFKESIENDPKLRTSDSIKLDHDTRGTNGVIHPTIVLEGGEEEKDDDDDEGDDAAYWAQYDNTPARTPAIKRSPAPDSMQNGSRLHSDEDAYYAQYASVQPAMDNHDPDEAMRNGATQTSLDRSPLTHQARESLSHHDSELSSSSHIWASDLPLTHPAPHSDPETDCRVPESDAEVLHPRPTSSRSSSSSETVEMLESSAAVQVQSEVGVKQHISSSMKSLFRLARASGIQRAEFKRLVKMELHVLKLMEEDD